MDDHLIVEARCGSKVLTHAISWEVIDNLQNSWNQSGYFQFLRIVEFTGADLVQKANLPKDAAVEFTVRFRGKEWNLGDELRDFLFPRDRTEELAKGLAEHLANTAREDRA